MTNLLFIWSLFFPMLGFSYENVPQAKPDIYGSSKNVKCPINVVPGKGIGPLEVGRSLEEIEGLGMEMKTVQGEQSHMIIGKYSVGVNEEGNLRYVQAEIGDLPNCIRFGKNKITKKMSSMQIAKIFSNCKKEQAAYGGNVIECDGISINTGGWGGKQKTPALKILAN